MKNELQSAKRAFYAAIAGTVVVAICCFTPLLVFLFVAVGLSAFTPYLDYVLFPALAVLMILTIISYILQKMERYEERQEMMNYSKSIPVGGRDERIRSYSNRRRLCGFCSSAEGC